MTFGPIRKPWPGLWPGLLALLLIAPSVRADEAHRGLYLSGSGHLLLLEGKGTWDGRDFDPTATMSDDEGTALGLNWAERLLIGVAPGLGYRFSDRFALQAHYAYFFPRRSSQAYSTTEGGGTYRQGLDWEWRQASIEAIALYYPAYSDANDWNLFVFGGAQRLMIDVDAVTSESLTALLGYDEYDTVSDYQLFSSGIDAWGGVIGAGVEIPAESMNVSTSLRLQYAYTPVDQTFFGTPDFEVPLGGFSFWGGLNWYFDAE